MWNVPGILITAGRFLDFLDLSIVLNYYSYHSISGIRTIIDAKGKINEFIIIMQYQLVVGWELECGSCLVTR